MRKVPNVSARPPSRGLPHAVTQQDKEYDMDRTWIRGIATAGMAWAALAVLAFGQNPTRNAAPPPANVNQVQQPAQAAQQPVQGAQATGQPVGANTDLLGPIDNLQDLQDAGKMLYKMADTNNDGQISQKEAIDAGNLMVGGFFFRADQNGDGTVSKEEAQQARDALLQQKPMLKFIVQRIKAEKSGKGNNANSATNSSRPNRGLMGLLDTNNDEKIEASELRQAVQTGVQGLFAAADTNRDNQLSPSEINAAMIGAARAAADAAFQTADTDHNGQLSREEYDKAIVDQANVLFAIVDANNDGQLSQDEIKSARKVVVAQLRMLRVPEPANSLRNLINTGRTPDQVAPVPVIGAPSSRRQ
jgi:Ca2+-binding EF-hand superfamily protein